MPRVDPGEYRVSFFEEKGFTRKRCKSCGEYFWTLNPEFDTCQDAPCVEYWFDRIRSAGPLSVGEARRRFIRFFEERGHTPLKPRPVVARWREDLYLTIASIVVFQPHVTSGLVPPPANPLVISQPSIRLEDIDNVGLTIGRHLTMFEMGGHHAFNYPDKWVYWKDETVRYAFEFFTREIGIPEDLIVFKESWWEGGGNAGPCFEVAVGGLELATLVFMQYKVTDGGYEPIPLKIVDTGYGIERIAWFTQKTPTAFHAIYGSLLPRFREKLGVEEPEEALLWEAFRAAGRLDPEDPASVEAFYSRIAGRLGMDVGEVRGILGREARLYSVLDHTKTLAFMLADGVVPSNTGEGYLARLVLRRAMRQLRLLGAEVSLADLVDAQVDYWSPDFPHLKERRDYILDAVRVEEERYRQTLARGERIIARLLARKRELSLDDLVKLYDSHGIPPEIVAEAASRRGIRVEVPHNFYSIVAARHRGPERLREVEERAPLPGDVVEWARSLGVETRRLFHEDPYLREFETRLAAARGRYVVLEATAFYPKGGGQDYDTGTLTIEGAGEFRVLEVYKVGGVIVHVLDREVEARPGARVRGAIDWGRRYRLMRHHTATHIILGAARRVLGSHVWQAGAEKTVEKGRLDLTHYKPLTPEEVRRIEELANRVVDERRPVTARLLDRNEAEERYGFTIYQGGVPMEPVIRIVEVKDWDVEACFGTHVANTGEIGAVKIVNYDKIQDGVIRLEYVAGTRVAEEAARLEERLGEIAEATGAPRGREAERVKSLVAQARELEERLREYRRLWLKEVMERVRAAEPVNGVRVAVVEAVEGDARVLSETLAQATREAPDALVAIHTKPENGWIKVEMAAGAKAAERIDLGSLAREAARRLNGKGGGRGSRASLVIPADALPRLEELIREALKAGGGE